MLKTLIGKFTFSFWIIFLIIATSLYLFTTLFVKDMLQNIEKEKVQIIIKTLSPIIALNISFEQNKELEDSLNIILQENNIQSVEISSLNIKKILQKKQISRHNLFSYTTQIKDPFSTHNIADIKISYSNEVLLALYNKILITLISILFMTSLIFLSFYIFIRKELLSLRHISDTLKKYSESKELVPIEIKKSSVEITTIASSANEMMHSISQKIKELKSFNSRLEDEVHEKIQTLQKQEKMLIHQSRQAAMGEMIESIAHQWRQPLNIIGLSCANLEMEYDLNNMSTESFKDKMKIIALNINYMSSTIDDFRNFLNPNEELEVFDPYITFTDVLKILDAQLHNNDISLEIHQKNSIKLLGIENEFKQVLFVLINNAKDAIKTLQTKGQIKKGKISVTISSTDEKNIISFCDNGGGIKEDIIHSIFEPYFSTKFASSGTGIGLYIAKNIIETRMKAQLHVKNIQDGCCFSISQNKNTQEN